MSLSEAWSGFVYFLTKILLSEKSLTPHQLWVFFLVLILTIVFTLAARHVKKEQGQRDPALVISALFMWGLLFDRFMITIRYEFLLYPEYQEYTAIWVPLRHLSLLSIELSLYALLYVLLRDSVKRWLRNRLKVYLDD